MSCSKKVLHIIEKIENLGGNASGQDSSYDALRKKLDYVDKESSSHYMEQLSYLLLSSIGKDKNNKRFDIVLNLMLSRRDGIKKLSQLLGNSEMFDEINSKDEPEQRFINKTEFLFALERNLSSPKCVETFKFDKIFVYDCFKGSLRNGVDGYHPFQSRDNMIKKYFQNLNDKSTFELFIGRADAATNRDGSRTKDSDYLDECALNLYPSEYIDMFRDACIDADKHKIKRCLHTLLNYGVRGDNNLVMADDVQRIKQLYNGLVRPNLEKLQWTDDKELQYYEDVWLKP